MGDGNGFHFRRAVFVLSYVVPYIGVILCVVRLYLAFQKETAKEMEQQSRTQKLHWLSFNGGAAFQAYVWNELHSAGVPGAFLFIYVLIFLPHVLFLPIQPLT